MRFAGKIIWFILGGAFTALLQLLVIERFRASGKGWQSRINEILKRA